MMYIKLKCIAAAKGAAWALVKNCILPFESQIAYDIPNSSTSFMAENATNIVLISLA